MIAEMSTIKVVDYDPEWPRLFEREKIRILGGIGYMVEDIHHVGSTSIVGLCAKPWIGALVDVPLAERVAA